MNIVNVLQEYSEIALEENLRGRILGPLYRLAEDYIRHNNTHERGRWFLFELFPRRGLIIPFIQFTDWLKSVGTSRVEVIRGNSFLARCLLGPGYRTFSGWLKSRYDNLKVYFQGKDYNIGLARSYEYVRSHEYVRFPENEGYLIPYDLSTLCCGPDNFCNPLWDILPYEIKINTKVEPNSVEIMPLLREEDLCIYVERYAIIFKFLDDLVLIYGIMDLITSKWVFNEKYESVKILYNYENQKNNSF